jgi:predicted component of type VI protein secretion system
MAKLVIHQPDGSLREVKLDRGRITIGRRADHDICLPYPAVSADHAEIVTVVSDSFLHDVGSTNGTLVNGARVTKHFLRDQDRIDIARQQLVYLANEAEEIEPLARQVSELRAAEPTPDEEKVGDAASMTDAAVKATQVVPMDELMTELMAMGDEPTIAIDFPPEVAVATGMAVVPETPQQIVAERPDIHAEATAGVYIEVMSGPNAGQITPMTKSEFVLGKAGASIAAIRRSEFGYRLVPFANDRMPTLNGRPIEQAGAWLEFGDTIGVGGIVLRFSRRAPL